MKLSMSVEESGKPVNRMAFHKVMDLLEDNQNYLSNCAVVELGGINLTSTRSRLKKFIESDKCLRDSTLTSSNWEEYYLGFNLYELVQA